MDDILRRANRISTFSHGYVFKARVITPTSNACVTLTDFSSDRFLLTGNLRHISSFGTITSTCTNSSISLSLFPKHPFSWLAVTVRPTRSGPVPGIRLKKSTTVSPHKLSGTIDYTLGGALPTLSAKARWSFPPVHFLTALTLSGAEQYGIAIPAAHISFATARWRGRFGCRGTADGRSVGGWVLWRRLKTGLFFGPRETVVFCSAPVCGGWELAWQGALKWQKLVANFFQSLSVGASGSCRGALLKAALDIRRKEVAAKWKTGIQSGEVALILTGSDFGCGKWRLGISVCHRHDPANQ
jgi:hypothetical protein